MSLRVAVQMDPLDTINIAGDSTFALMLGAQARGHKLYHYLAQDLTYQDGRLYAGVHDVSVQAVADKQGKWVRRPHGPATVSGYASLGPGPVLGLDPPLSSGLGRRAQRISRRESGNLASGDVPVFRRGERRRSPPCSIGQPRAAISWSGGADVAR